MQGCLEISYGGGSEKKELAESKIHPGNPSDNIYHQFTTLVLKLMTPFEWKDVQIIQLKWILIQNKRICSRSSSQQEDAGLEQ